MPRHLPLLALLAMLPALLSADSDRPAADLAGTVVDRSPMSLDLSPDRSLVATANHTSGTVSLVEIDSGRVLYEARCGRRPVDVAWWNARTLLVSLSQDDAVAVMSWQDGRLRLVRTLMLFQSTSCLDTLPLLLLICLQGHYQYLGTLPAPALPLGDP